MLSVPTYAKRNSTFCFTRYNSKQGLFYYSAFLAFSLLLINHLILQYLSNSPVNFRPILVYARINGDIALLEASALVTFRRP